MVFQIFQFIISHLKKSEITEIETKYIHFHLATRKDQNYDGTERKEEGHSVGTSRYEVSSRGGVFTVFRFPHAAPYGLSFDAAQRQVNAISSLARRAIKGLGGTRLRRNEFPSPPSFFPLKFLAALPSCR